MIDKAQKILIKNSYNPFKEWTLGYRKKAYLILALIGLTFSFSSIWEIKPVSLDINDFLGLTSHLTMAYWLGLGIITFCSIFIYIDKELDSVLLFIIILILVGLIIFGLGVFSYSTVRNPASYYPAGEVKNVLLTNHIDTLSDAPLISYRSWPAMHIISAFILYIGNIDIINLIKYMPLFWLLSFIFISFSIGKKLNFSLNNSFLLSFLSISSFWVSQYYYSPQSFAFLMYLLIFALVIGSFMNYNLKITDKFLFLLIFTTIVIEHLLTTITVLLAIIFFLNYKLFKKKQTCLLVILFLVIFSAWYIYLSRQVLIIGIPDFIEKVINMESYSLAKTKLNPISQTELLSKLFQLTYVFIFIVLLIGSLILKYFKTKEAKTKLVLNPIYFWLTGIFFISIIAYGTETYERMYLFSLIPLLCIIIMSFEYQKIGKKLFVSLMVIFSLLIIPALYGNDIIGTSFQTELSGAEFFSLRIKPSDHYFDSYFYQTDKFLFYFNSDLLPIKHEFFYNDYNTSLIDNVKYVLNSKETNTRFIFTFGFNPLQKWLDKNEKQVNLIYNNGFFETYKRLG